MPKEIEFESVEIVKGKIVRSKRVETYPDSAVRHCDWCTVCGWPDYPACIETCDDLKRNEELNRE